ncbi:MAG: AzlC family ABC transporter permease [Anaerolineales bacterium]|jgi:predicted branched-subunit amino acid permease
MSQAKNKMICREFAGGVRALSPILLGVIPFGLTTGIAVAQTGITVPDGAVMSVLVFSGAALLVALQLIQTGAPILITIASALMVNLRFMIYSASVAPHLKRLPRKWKLLLGYLLSDQAYAASIAHLENNSGNGISHWFFLGAGLTMWFSWQISLVLGMLLGLSLPAEWSLDFTIPLTFLALAVSPIRDKSTALAALAAGVSVVLLSSLPYKLGIVAAGIVGIGVGILAEKGGSK